MSGNGAKRTRAFICVDAPQGIAGRIAEVSAAMGSWMRLVQQDQMHITLFFFRGLNERQIDSAVSVMDGGGIDPFEVQLGRLCVFDVKRPEVVFVNVESEGLRRIYNYMKPCLEARGLPVDGREFVPHLTVGRARRTGGDTGAMVAEFLERNGAIEFGSFMCTEIKLMKSTLTERGPMHELIYAKEL